MNRPEGCRCKVDLACACHVYAADLLAACEAVIAELEEQNAQEGLSLAFTDSAEYLTVGFRAMVAAVKKAKT